MDLRRQGKNICIHTFINFGKIALWWNFNQKYLIYTEKHVPANEHIKTSTVTIVFQELKFKIPPEMNWLDKFENVSISVKIVHAMFHLTIRDAPGNSYLIIVIIYIQLVVNIIELGLIFLLSFFIFLSRDYSCRAQSLSSTLEQTVDLEIT